jgi:ribonuclease BN (tRNA processing enzyme)
MNLTFLGTRGNTKQTTRRHRRHSALMIEHGGAKVMIDCGADWRSRIGQLAPHAIFVTHAHPDHAWGLETGAPCPVYATAESWLVMADYPIGDRRVLEPRRSVCFAGLSLEAFRVDHSIRAPAVGFRIVCGDGAIFYVPDVVAIPERKAALDGIDVFVGDGATLTRPMVRRQGGRLFGHTTVRAQLGWCRQAGVAQAIFTHCGTEIIAGDERRLGAELRAMARARGLAARIAYDGLKIAVP